MIKMIGRMKKNFILIIAILILLLGQAYVDLSLPAYTSRIVDTGITQKGVEDGVPETIREESLKGLGLMMDQDQYDYVASKYTLKDGIYSLNKMDTEDREELADRMMEAEVVLAMLSQQGMDITMLPPEQIQVIKHQVDEKMKDYPEATIKQVAIAFVQAEYEAQDISLDDLQTSFLIKAGLQMLLLAALGMIAAILVTFIASRIAAELGKDLRNDIYRKVLTFGSHEMNQFSTASLITRSTNDIQQVQMVMTMMFRIIIYAPILAIGGLVKVVQTGAYLSWILIVGIGAVSALMLILFTIVMPKFKVLQSKIDRLNLISREILTGIPVIRAFSTERHEEERFEDANADLTRTNLFVNRAMALMIPTMMLIMNGISVLIIFSGAHGIDEGKLQVGDMMAFIQYAMQIIMSFLMIAAIAIFMPRASVSAKRINEVLDTEPDITNPEHTRTPNDDLKGNLVFDNVTFRYPGAEEDVIHNISFQAKQGQTVAFIGSTGSGKSTLVNLIPRFFDVSEGSITLDGVDIRDFDLKDLRNRIGMVPQKSVLFSGTIASNMRFGNDDATDEEVMDAIRIAQGADFVSEKPEGINSHMAQGGTNVSGGQKQRLAIARAIAKRPEIYIFDDSFSALDFKTDAALRKALKEETSDVTALIVAQRVSTIMDADLIIVLEEGNVVGRGNHQSLMKDCDVYQQIANSQLSAEELEKSMRKEEA